jgi:hypothetical protein
MATRNSLLRLRWLLPALVLVCAAATVQAATITIINGDGPGEGFNDPTPVTPVGGNPGTTLGEQRQIVFEAAATIWGSALPSDVEIRVNAQFDPLSCTATSGVLGSAGTTYIFRDFPGAEFPGTWYTSAEADKLAGTDQNPGSADISTTFNSNIGNPGCLETTFWYYGLDGNEGNGIELLPVVLHELAHGLGFATFANLSTGALFNGYPDIYTRFMWDETIGLHWHEMTNTQRQASAVNTFNVYWDGAATRFMAPLTLSARELLRVNAPPPIAGDMMVGTASFGPPLSFPGVSGLLVLAEDGTAPTSDACTALINGAEIAGNIALVDRGSCAFTTKVKNAQNAGAIGVVVGNNVAGSYPIGMSGTDPTITIPSVFITKEDADWLKSQLGVGVNVSLMTDPALYAGADAQGRVMLYAPDPIESGSSISHWDVTATPNLLMEPAINDNLSSDVDLTLYLFEDIGWLPPTTDAPDGGTPAGVTLLQANTPNPFKRSTSIRFELPREGRAVLGVYDLSGRLVRRLLEAHLPAGNHVTLWDGTDADGRKVPSGVYFSRLRVGGEIQSRRMVVLD